MKCGTMTHVLLMMLLDENYGNYDDDDDDDNDHMRLKTRTFILFNMPILKYDY
jgi:hypothetical protein